MDNLDLAARIEGIAFSYRAQADMFSGRRRQWRLNRADFLQARAWALIGGEAS